MLQYYIAERCLGYQQITTLSAATALTFPVGTTLALITAEGQAVRWRDDAVDPTTTVGYPLAVGVELRYTALGQGKLKFIEQVASAKLNIVYYGDK